MSGVINRPFSAARSDIVVGLGNILMSDEGIGVRVVRELSESAHLFPDVEFVEVGTAVMSVVHVIAARRRAFIVDCAQMGEMPGTIRRFTADEAVSLRISEDLSSHEGGLLQAVLLSKNLGECPSDLSIFGIQPDTIRPGEVLSDALSSRMDDYVEAVTRELLQEPRG